MSVLLRAVLFQEAKDRRTAGSTTHSHVTDRASFEHEPVRTMQQVRMLPGAPNLEFLVPSKRDLRLREMAWSPDLTCLSLTQARISQIGTVADDWCQHVAATHRVSADQGQPSRRCSASKPSAKDSISANVVGEGGDVSPNLPFENLPGRLPRAHHGVKQIETTMKVLVTVPSIQRTSRTLPLPSSLLGKTAPKGGRTRLNSPVPKHGAHCHNVACRLVSCHNVTAQFDIFSPPESLPHEQRSLPLGGTHCLRCTSTTAVSARVIVQRPVSRKY
jgi:hypothetical protein